jgi:hypothetical protein
MPGTYAHITLVDTLCIGRTLAGIGTLEDPVIHSLLDYAVYCELGSVSPDYPYLSLGDVNAEGWANGMHYSHSGDFVQQALRRLVTWNYHDVAAQKGIAWLFGFVAHIVADVSMHPIINRIVGPYEQNKKEHRRCEAHQDAYIFTKMNLGDINKAEHISNCGIAECSAGKRLDPDISGLWLDCLSVIPIGQPVKDGIHGPTTDPDIDHWHSRFLFVMEEVTDELAHFPLISRVFDHVLGIGYPESGELDWRYIRNLPTPGGGTRDYDDLFRWTQENIRGAWRNLGQVLQDRDESPLTLVNADLDLGEDMSGQSIYWKEQIT